jgi:hypothetical protein
MSLSQKTFEGYLVKAGVDLRLAATLAMNLGEPYLEFQAQWRSMGEGGRSKALAASSLLADANKFVEPGDENSLNFAYRVIIARKMVDTFGEIRSVDYDNYSEDWKSCCSAFSNNSIGATEKYETTVMQLQNELREAEIRSHALAESKGFFSKIFG